MLKEEAMENFKINSSLEVGKLAALDQSKIINLKDEDKKNNANMKAKKSESKEQNEGDANVPANKLVDMANQFIKRFSTKVTFKYDPQNNQSKILVIEKETGKVIREIPPQQMVDLMQKMEDIAGIIYNGRV